MRKHSNWAAVAAAIVIALFATGVAGAAQRHIRVVLGNLVLTVSGGVTPTQVPKHELAPIGFNAAGALTTVDKSHPPAWKAASFDVDRDIVIDVTGIPVCRSGQLRAQNSADARNACPGALLGQGRGSVEVAFEEQRPFEASGPVLLFNGGEKNGVTTLYLHTYVSIPAPTAIVVVAKATREKKGPYGLHIETAIPLIAGGAGSITSFELGARRSTTYRGERRSFLFARCSDGSFRAQGQVTYRDGTLMHGAISVPCTAKG